MLISITGETKTRGEISKRDDGLYKKDRDCDHEGYRGFLALNRH